VCLVLGSKLGRDPIGQLGEAGVLPNLGCCSRLSERQLAPMRWSMRVMMAAGLAVLMLMLLGVGPAAAQPGCACNGKNDAKGALTGLGGLVGVTERADHPSYGTRCDERVRYTTCWVA